MSTQHYHLNGKVGGQNEYSMPDLTWIAEEAQKLSHPSE